LYVGLQTIRTRKGKRDPIGTNLSLLDATRSMTTKLIWVIGIHAALGVQPRMKLSKIKRWRIELVDRVSIAITTPNHSITNKSTIFAGMVTVVDFPH